MLMCFYFAACKTTLWCRLCSEEIKGDLFLFQVFATTPQVCQDFMFCKNLPQKGIHFSGKISTWECKGVEEDGYH